MGLFDVFIRIGEKRFGVAGNNPNLEDEAELRFAEIQVEKQIAVKEQQQLRDEYSELKETIKEEETLSKTSPAKARFDYRSGWFGISLAGPMVTTCICLAFYSIAPGFYGREHIAYLICVGCGIAIAIAGHVLLECLQSSLTARQLRNFIIYTSLLMLVLGLGGSIMLGAARSHQWELQSRLNTDSALELQAKEEEAPVNIEGLKRDIEKLTSRALIIWFLALDWMGAILLFLGVSKIRTNKAIVMLVRRRKRVKARIKKLESRLAYLETITKDNIVNGMKVGLSRANHRGSPAMLALVTVAFLASIIGFLILSESMARGEEPRCHVLCAIDVTSSDKRDRLENERAILRIIDSLKPGDSLQVMLITEATFSDPSYLLDAKLPARSGYFKELVLKAKRQLINEFRAKAQTISHSRCATSLFDGIYLFNELLKENPAEFKVLVILSDMIQTAQGITPVKLAKDGDTIISRLKDDNLIPDMHGIDVYVMGASTHGIGLRSWTQLKKFWQKYFMASGAKLKTYSIGRGPIN